MRFELSYKNLRAAAESLGGELVSLVDQTDTEYIWGGEAPFWHGRNPVLFPVVGKLRDDRITVNGKSYGMKQHGFARRSEFTVVEQAQDHIVFELRENEQTLTQYPFPFILQVRHQLTEQGFSTTYRVENTGTETLPFCIGAHTAFRCPLREDEQFEEYQIVFDQPEEASTMLYNEQKAVRHTAREALLDHQDRFSLDYAVFARLDTIMLEGLRSAGVSLRNEKSGRGVRMEFPGFPMIAFWTQGVQKAPFICLEPWHGCADVENEDGTLQGKRHCICLQPGESKELTYTVSIL